MLRILTTNVPPTIPDAGPHSFGPNHSDPET